ncbi:hypothetical protein [Azohydromonas aeria]|uniref:hypothetical protein n=1 Tax=Azohydromonas aeria TaxID=2590212 RepID=UPI0012F758A2|nr:hypothetical protein [Azohydromonas aeria]
MSIDKKKIWMEGFHAGQSMDSKLPYPSGTAEARAWLEGWVQGIHANGQSVDKHENRAFNDSDLQGGKDTREIAQPRPSIWKRFIESLLK